MPTTPQSGWGFEIGHLLADSDMNSNQYKFVATGSAAGYFELGTGASNPMPIGVLQDDPKSGQPGNIRVLGTARVAASGTIGFGDMVTSGSNGFAILQTSTAGSPVNSAGVALSALASGSGYIEVLLTPSGLITADNTP